MTPTLSAQEDKPAVATRPPPVPTELGPLLAVAGLCGGAGASTLAYLLAKHATIASGLPVLACDTGGPTAGLAAYSGIEVAHSLPRLANALAASDRPGTPICVDDGTGLRIIARRPALDPPADADGLARVLGDARAAHALTVVDCGTLRGPTERHALALATHVAWVIPTNRVGIARSAATLDLFELDGARPEVLVARNDPAEAKPPIEELTRMAERRRAPLVLMPSVPDLARQPVTEALDATGQALEAIHSILRR